MADNKADTVLNEIRRIFADTLTVFAPSADADLLDSGMMDSLTLVTLISELEQAFAIDILQQDFEIDRFRSQESIAAFVAGLLVEKDDVAGACP